MKKLAIIMVCLIIAGYTYLSDVKPVSAADDSDPWGRSCIVNPVEK